MKLKFVCSLALVFLSSSSTKAGLKAEDQLPGFRLQLEEETYLTSKSGVASPEQVSKAQLGRTVRIYRTDGFCYTGVVTEIQESEGVFKIYGKINNVKNTQFGFVLAAGGIFAGAVLETDEDKAYVLELSPEHKGYVLMFTSKYRKPAA